jgi:hypothetical protein
MATSKDINTVSTGQSTTPVMDNSLLKENSCSTRKRPMSDSESVDPKKVKTVNWENQTAMPKMGESETNFPSIMNCPLQGWLIDQYSQYLYPYWSPLLIY